jgi:hypothetical protein
MPTLAEVRAILDEPLEGPAAGITLEEVVVGDDADHGVANE